MNAGVHYYLDSFNQEQKPKKKDIFKVAISKVYFLLSKFPASSSRALHKLFQDILCIIMIQARIDT
jgi:hypothetical protein